MTEIQTSAGDGSRASSTAPSPTPSAQNAPRYGTVIPNRIFVGGIAFNTNEVELKTFFTAFGQVKEAKIIADRAGVSKGYGFITFETPEEVIRILKEQPNSLVFKDKKLNIGQAIRKQPTRFPKESDPNLMPNGMLMHSPSGAYSYTYHNGVAYFNPNDPMGLIPGPAGHATAAAASIAHHPQAPQPTAYSPFAVPVMIPPSSMHQYVTTQPQPPQFAYPQAISSSPPWTSAAAGQYRFIHPQAAALQAGGLIYPTPPGSELIYTAGPPASHHHHHIQPGEVSEVPVMDTAAAAAAHAEVGSPGAMHKPWPQLLMKYAQNAGVPGYGTAYGDPRAYMQTAAVPAEHQIGQTVVARSPYYQEIAYTTAVDANGFHTLVPKPTAKFGKRPIKMPYRERAVKTIRTTADGTAISGMLPASAHYEDGAVITGAPVYPEN